MAFQAECLKCHHMFDVLSFNNCPKCGWHFPKRGEDRKNIIGRVKDLVSELLWYGRKEDDDVPRGLIEDCVKDGTVSADEIIKIFADELKAHVEDDT